MALRSSIRLTCRCSEASLASSSCTRRSSVMTRLSLIAGSPAKRPARAAQHSRKAGQVRRMALRLPDGGVGIEALRRLALRHVIPVLGDQAVLDAVHVEVRVSYFWPGFSGSSSVLTVATTTMSPSATMEISGKEWWVCSGAAGGSS